MSIVYVIFAKDRKEFDRTVEELSRHYGLNIQDDPRYRVHAEDAMHIMVMQEKLDKTIFQAKQRILNTFKAAGFDFGIVDKDLTTKEAKAETIDGFLNHLKTLAKQKGGKMPDVVDSDARAVYKNKLTFVYAPEQCRIGLDQTVEHKNMIDSYNLHMEKGTDFDIMRVEEFIKTDFEIEEEARKKRMDMEDWFSSRLRTVGTR